MDDKQKKALLKIMKRLAKDNVPAGLTFDAHSPLWYVFLMLQGQTVLKLYRINLESLKPEGGYTWLGKTPEGTKLFEVKKLKEAIKLTMEHYHKVAETWKAWED